MPPKAVSGTLAGMNRHHPAVRFRDPLTGLRRLAADDIHVVCPGCGCRAVVRAQPGGCAFPMHWPRRFVCTRCVTAAEWKPKGGTSTWGRPVDPFFRLPLWLRAGCCGGRTLWAFNEAHLTVLADHVGARLRERDPRRPGMTMVARLPKWLKSAKNRDEILRVITRLTAEIPPPRSSESRPTQQP